MNVRRDAVYRNALGAKLGFEMILRRAMAVDPASRFSLSLVMARLLH